MSNNPGQGDCHGECYLCTLKLIIIMLIIVIDVMLLVTSKYPQKFCILCYRANSTSLAFSLAWLSFRNAIYSLETQNIAC